MIVEFLIRFNFFFFFFAKFKYSSPDTFERSKSLQGTESPVAISYKKWEKKWRSWLQANINLIQRATSKQQ